jgi:transposase
MAREVYYRQFSNRRQVAGFLGLATSPYDSGQMERSQGISTPQSGVSGGSDVWL